MPAHMPAHMPVYMSLHIPIQLSAKVEGTASGGLSRSLGLTRIPEHASQHVAIDIYLTHFLHTGWQRLRQAPFLPSTTRYPTRRRAKYLQLARPTTASLVNLVELVKLLVKNELSA